VSYIVVGPMLGHYILAAYYLGEMGPVFEWTPKRGSAHLFDHPAAAEAIAFLVCGEVEEVKP
jgi:hypothetical protein